MCAHVTVTGSLYLGQEGKLTSSPLRCCRLPAAYHNDVPHADVAVIFRHQIREGTLITAYYITPTYTNDYTVHPAAVADASVPS